MNEDVQKGKVDGVLHIGYERSSSRCMIAERDTVKGADNSNSSGLGREWSRTFDGKKRSLRD